MTWYDIRWNGQTYIENLTGNDEKELTLLGIHGYATQAEAEAHPQTMNEVQALAGGANILAGTVVGPADQPGDILGGAGTTANAASSVTSDAASVVKFLGDLESRSLWLRILKGVAGIALVIIGTIHLFGGTVRGAAGGAAKAAVLA